MVIYKEHVRWTKDFVKNNIHIIEKNYKLHPYRNRWNCNVHAVYDNDTENVYRIDYIFLRKEYEKIAAKVTKKFGIKKYWLTEIWYNYYKKGQFQEPHHHLGVDGQGAPGGLTGVHYLIFDPKYHSQTLFTDPNIKPLNARCGDIVFFKDDVMHYVPENESDKPRLTIAFTICTDVHDEKGVRRLL